MQGQTIGYKRVSTVDQNTGRQLEGLVLDRIFEDKLSGKDTNRPQLESLKQFARDGDTIIIHSMDRLARNLFDLRQLIDYFTTKGVKVQFVKENLTFSGDDSPMSILLLNIMGGFAEFERALILERQREGIALAKQRGAYTGRKPLASAKVQELRQRVQAGEVKARIARDLGISQGTLYRYLKEG